MDEASDLLEHITRTAMFGIDERFGLGIAVGGDCVRRLNGQGVVTISKDDAWYSPGRRR